MSDTDTGTFTQPEVNRIVEDRLARDRKERVSVVSEERTYGPSSPNSFYLDSVAAAMPTGGFDTSPSERLDRHAREVAYEIEHKTPEGRWAEHIIRESTRVESAIEHERRYKALLREYRALTTGGGSTASASGGSFAALVPPFFLLAETAPFHGIERAFADSCHNLPLPAFGMEIYVPAFTTTEAVAQQSEQLGAPAAPVPTTSASGGTVLAGIYTVAVTYVSASGETVASATGAVTTSGTTSTITVPSPAASFGATGWYAYVSQAGGGAGAMTRQQAPGSPTNIGTNLILTAPPTNTGTAPPGSNTSGGVAETDPTTGLQGGLVVTLTGQITASQQFMDRGATGGGSVDILIQKDLTERLEEKVDLYALNTVIAVAGTVTGSASLTANSLKEVYSDLGKAREGITDTAGVRLRPTHLFTTYDMFSGLSDIMGSDGRPMVMPTEMPGFPLVEGADDGDANRRPKWSRFTGVVLPGGVLWFTDDNIPASGSNTQLIVSAPEQSVVLLESPVPTFTVYPQTMARNLEVVLNLRSYACCIARHASGTQVYSGNAYPTTLK